MGWIETIGQVEPGKEGEIHDALMKCRESRLLVLHHFHLDEPDSPETVVISIPADQHLTLMTRFHQYLNERNQANHPNTNL